MQSKNNHLAHTIVLLFGMFIAGITAVAIGKELNWDLASYHFYNPFALLHHRSSMDIWPMEYVHVHLAPTADFITYFFVTYLQPQSAVFALGAMHGINLWLLYGISLNLFSNISHKYILTFVLAVLGMYGPTVVPALGSFQHDALISIFVLGFVWIFLRAYQQNFSPRLLLIAGTMLGIGAGLKLTAGIFVLSALISVLFIKNNFRQKVCTLMWLSLGVMAGLLITSGYWFVMQWQTYHNPVYPFMNGIFHATGFPASSWKDARFMPQNFWQAVFFPFYFSFDGRTNDVPFRDFRFIALYIMLGVALLKRVTLPAREQWLLIFSVLAFIVWEAEFSIMRYAMPLEMLAPLLIFILLNAVCQQTAVRNGWVFFLTVLIVMGMYPAQAVRAPWYAGDYFNVKLPASIQQQHDVVVLVPVSAYALALQPRPQTYLIGYLPTAWHYVGIPYQDHQYSLSLRTTKFISEFNGKIYLLTSSEFLPNMIAAAKMLHLTADGDCEDIYSDRQKISGEDVKLCPFKKLSSPTDLG